MVTFVDTLLLNISISALVAVLDHHGPAGGVEHLGPKCHVRADSEARVDLDAAALGVKRVEML